MLAPHYSQVVRRALPWPSCIPLLQGSSRLFIRTVSSALCDMDIVIPKEEKVPGPPPWMLPVPEVHYILTSTAAHPTPQQQQALETVATVLSFLPYRLMDGQVVRSTPLILMLHMETGRANIFQTLIPPRFVSFVVSWMQSAFCASVVSVQ
ncbi:uncharacterized protein LOC135107815 [Scylla paramamosain]|uniref:uncharacterized protein LOC135107815 n=1 Tax=Scylla paramamosain TaxID=85552 RepID=UPI0030828763